MNKLDIFKGVTELVVSVGVSSLVANAIKMTADPKAGRFKQIATGIGGFVLSNMVSEAATVYTDKKIDNIADKVQRIIHPSPLDLTEAEVEAAIEKLEPKHKEEGTP